VVEQTSWQQQAFKWCLKVVDALTHSCMQIARQVSHRGHCTLDWRNTKSVLLRCWRCHSHLPGSCTMLALNLELQYTLNLLSPRQNFLLLLSCECLWKAPQLTVKDHIALARLWRNLSKTLYTSQAKHSFNKFKTGFCCPLMQQTLLLCYLLLSVLKQALVTADNNHLPVTLWAAATCTASPTVIAGQYATSNCKPLLVMFM